MPKEKAVTRTELNEFKSEMLDAIREIANLPPAGLGADHVPQAAVPAPVMGYSPDPRMAMPDPFANMQNVPYTPPMPTEPSYQPGEQFLPPVYQAIFEKYFDPEDGFEARFEMPAKNAKGHTSGFMFSIIVPMKFSNALDAYRDFYKVDIRSKALRGDDVAKTIEEWCKLVARNLKYDRNKVAK
jgi:hypothetical protein